MVILLLTNILAIVWLKIINRIKLFSFSGLRVFYYVGLCVLFMGDIFTVFSIEEFNIEYLYRKFLLYGTFFVVLNIYQILDEQLKNRLAQWLLFGTILFTSVQLLLSSTGDYWIWGGETLIGELSNIGGFARVVNFLWIMCSATLGVFIMQLMSDIDRDREFVYSLFIVLFFLVIMIGTGGYGLYPRLWIWIYMAIYFGMCDRYIGIWLDTKEKQRPSDVNILGLRVDNVDREEAVDRMEDLIRGRKLSLVITPYSEFFVKIQKNKNYRRALDYSNLSIPDGIYVNWASLYQHLPVSSNILIRIFQSIWQYVFTGASIIFFPRLVRAVVKARVSGSDIIYPVCALAEKEKYKVMLYGGFDFGNGNTGVLAAKKLKKIYKKLNIVNVYPGNKEDETDEEALELINKYQPDILFMCLGTREPEWVYKRRNQMKCGMVMALGGTFDYVAGDAVKVNRDIAEAGLEWFVRPIMLMGTGGMKGAVNRFKRVWTGMMVGSFMVLAWKIKFGYIERDKI